MKSKTLSLIAFIATYFLISTGCASTKGYVGDKLSTADLARIYQGTRKLQIKNKKTSEAALLVSVDSLSVGNYMKGFPKYVDVKGGERSIEVRHFQQWKDKAAMAGAMFGIVGASIAESNNPHTHYRLTFSVEQSKSYTIIPVTDEVTEVPEFFVVNNLANDTIRPQVVQLERNKND